MATVPAWFNVDWYLTSKAGKDVPAKASGEEVRAELAAANYVGDEGIYQHYLDWGVKEGVEPFDPATFDDQAYLEAKAANDNDGKTAEQLAAELAQFNMTPMQHFLLYAADEGTPYVPGSTVTPEGPSGEVSEVAAALEELKVAQKELNDAVEASELEGVADAEDADAALAAAAGVVDALGGKINFSNAVGVDSDTTAKYDEKAISAERASLELGLEKAQDSVSGELGANIDALASAQSDLQEAVNEAVDAKAGWPSPVST